MGRKKSPTVDLSLLNELRADLERDVTPVPDLPPAPVKPFGGSDLIEALFAGEGVKKVDPEEVEKEEQKAASEDQFERVLSDLLSATGLLGVRSLPERAARSAQSLKELFPGLEEEEFKSSLPEGLTAEAIGNIQAARMRGFEEEKAKFEAEKERAKKTRPTEIDFETLTEQQKDKILDFALLSERFAMNKGGFDKSGRGGDPDITDAVLRQRMGPFLDIADKIVLERYPEEGAEQDGMGQVEAPTQQVSEQTPPQQLGAFVIPSGPRKGQTIIPRTAEEAEELKALGAIPR